MLRLKNLFFIFCLLVGLQVTAQEIHIINGDTLELRQEVAGPLTLFWVEKDRDYRFFVQKNNRMIELLDEPVEGERRRRYQLQLEELTRDAGISVKDVKFLLYSLRHFVNRYNARVQEDYVYNAATPNFEQRVALLVGLSNNRYTRNPENILSPILVLEYEFFDPNLAPRHSGFLQLRQSFKREEYTYSSTQLSVNYRFKFLYFSGFDMHIDTELATFFYSEDRVIETNSEGEIIAVQEESGFSFTAPFSFGVGADIKINEHGYISLGYNDIVSLVMSGNGSFPLDFTVGYKYNF